MGERQEKEEYKVVAFEPHFALPRVSVAAGVQMELTAKWPLSGSRTELNEQVAAYVADAVLLHPDTPRAELAAMIDQELRGDVRAELALMLVRDHLAKLIRTERRKDAKPRQPALPGFDHLPRRVEVGRNKTKSILDCTQWDLGRYIYSLGRRHEQHRKNDLKLKEAQKLQARLKRAPQGMTVRRLLSVATAHPS